MGEPQPGAGDSPPTAPPNPLSPEELANVVSGMNRFLARFAGMKAFKDAQLGVADWTLLMILQDKKETTSPMLAWLSGIVVQRVIRILDPLIAAGLVSSVPSTDPEKPNPVLSLTEAGKARLAAFNDVLQPLLVKAMANNERGLLAIKNNLLFLMRVAPPE